MSQPLTLPVSTNGDTTVDTTNYGGSGGKVGRIASFGSNKVLIS